MTYKTLYTFDHDGGKVSEDARLLTAMPEGATASPHRAYFGDCWVRLYTEPYSTAPHFRHLAPCPIPCHVDPPGGNSWWLTPEAEIVCLDRPID